ncbi:MAG: hypothetical protein KGL39_08640 [Patescibacteria group bacterium]|nr:hypothetical protein [Patescibacteria group bacterium]
MASTFGYANGITTLANGANALEGVGETYSFSLSLPSTGGEVSIFLTDNTTAYQVLVGFGNVSGQVFTYVTTFNEKLYGLAGPSVFCSATQEPSTFNDPNAVGNGYVTLSNWYATTETLVAVVPYQGRLAFFSRRTAQIFVIDASLSNWQQQQILTNIGTLSALSVQSLGDLDVMFLSDTGIRSLRVRDQSLNAFVNDIGSPIDSLIQTALLSGTGPSACGIVEPQANRYWCYLNGLIYVLSYFQASKITAWSTYLPTYGNDLSPSSTTYSGSGTVTFSTTIGRSYCIIFGANDTSLVDGANTYEKAAYMVQSFVATTASMTLYGTASTSVTATLEEQTPFAPLKFLVYNGQVYARDNNGFYLYGGSDNNTYDGAIASVSTPWLDAKSPVIRKNSEGFDSAFQGAWIFYAGMNQLNETLLKVCQVNQPTFQNGSYSFALDGYHIQFKAQTYDNQYARLSSFVFRYQPGEEK